MNYYFTFEGKVSKTFKMGLGTVLFVVVKNNDRIKPT